MLSEQETEESVCTLVQLRSEKEKGEGQDDWFPQ